MSSTEQKNVLDRRGFLKGASVAGVAGVAAAPLSGKPASAGEPEDRKKASGYQETEHVMKFYELSRF